MSHRSDVAILGGGLAGLSLALQCRGVLPKARISVFERNVHPVPEAAHKVGESSVEAAAHYFTHILGLQQHIKEQQLPKLGLRFFFPAGDNSRIENRLEVGGTRFAPSPSFQIDRGRFENFLVQRCLEMGVRVVNGASMKAVRLHHRRAHEVMYEVAGSRHEESTRWVVDASGRRGILKRKLGLQMPSAHNGNSVWFRIGKRIAIDDWSTDTRWKTGHGVENARWYSTNHLMGEGYWVWLIPLASGSTSIGIVAAEPFHALTDFNSLEKAVAWLETHEPQCAESVKHNIDHIQDFVAVKNYSMECQQVFSRHRWGITGEAGFFHDPFYSPGSDFIAFANSFLTDLIQRDMSGRPFRIRAFSYDRIFKKFFYGTMVAYEDQYQMFGNPRVMPLKILWDYLVYWSITAFIFMHGRMFEMRMYVRNLRRLSRLGRINESVQEVFRSWHAATNANCEASGRIDTSQIPMIREMNSRLADEMDGRTFRQAFETNVQQLETLATEISAWAGIELRHPPKRRSSASVKVNALENAFAVTTSGPLRPDTPEAISIG